MFKFTHWKKLNLICLLFFFCAATLIYRVPMAGAQTEPPLTEVREILENYYVDPLSAEVLEASSLEEMLEKLGDPYTQYFTQQEYEDFINSINMQFSGLGIVIDMLPAGVLVVEVYDDSPAAGAGLKPGDIITEVDGTSMAGLSREEAITYLRGPEGSQVNLVVQRGEDSFTVSLTRQVIEVPTVSGQMLENRIAWVRISSFGEDTATRFAQLVKQLYQERPAAWIIDLRNNPGGYVDTAQQLGGYFFSNKVFSRVSGQAWKENLTTIIDQSSSTIRRYLKGPIILLINGYSASASEMLAAAIKDYDRATLLGSTSYGKGCMQAMSQLSNGDWLKFTVARFYSPLGHNIDKEGVKPDLALPEESDALAASLLLLSGQNASKTELASFKAGPNTFRVNLAMVRQPENWQLWQRIITAASGSNWRLYDKKSWRSIGKKQIKELWPLYFPTCRFAGRITDFTPEGSFYFSTGRQIDWAGTNNELLELIDASSGERIPVSITPVDNRRVLVTPAQSITDRTCWLVLHPGARTPTGTAVKDSYLAIIGTTTASVVPLQQPATAKFSPVKHKSTGYGIGIKY